MRGRLLDSSINFTINWFSDNVQAGIFETEHEGWIKMNENLSNRQLVACIITPQHVLKS